MTATAPASPEALSRWVAGQRWFDRSGDGTGSVTFTDPAPLPNMPTVGLQLAETGAGHRYQLLVPVGPPSARGRGEAPEVPEVAGAPGVAEALVRLAVDQASFDAPVGTVAGHWLEGTPTPGDGDSHPLGAEQSNTSVAVGGSHVLKVFRRLAPGVHPEVEVGRHLHAVAERSPGGPPLPVAPLAGWYDLTGPDGSTTTLGVVNGLVPGALDGWALALSALTADPGGLLNRLHRLGASIALLHGALAEPSTTADRDAFGRTAFTADRLSDVVRSTVTALGQLEPTVAAPAAARLAEHVEDLASRLDPDDLGPAIRTHGDLHLGQTVVGPHGWVVLDFEGEPARPLEERRLPHSPLRDVAGLLRSLSYAVETVRRSGTAVAEGWEPAARAAVLDGYFAEVATDLTPRSVAATADLLRLFEAEKIVYEVGYEISHRPDWVRVPLTALERLR